MGSGGGNIAHLDIDRAFRIESARLEEEERLLIPYITHEAFEV